MALYKDSLGNTYTRVLSGNEKPTHTAKSTKVKTEKKRHNKHRDTSGNTRPTSKYARYRRTRGKPLGPGQPGNKSGKHKVRRDITWLDKT
jgi:hypothetical protein